MAKLVANIWQWATRRNPDPAQRAGVNASPSKTVIIEGTLSGTSEGVVANNNLAGSGWRSAASGINERFIGNRLSVTEQTVKFHLRHLRQVCRAPPGRADIAIVDVSSTALA
jgi:hypothetical protein